MFVNGGTETVSDGKGNTIWVKAKMDRLTEAQVSSDLLKLGGEGIIALRMQEHCLLRRNIVRWAGPLFTDKETGQIMPVAPTSVDHLDPLDRKLSALLKAAVEKIAELNTAKEVEVTPEEVANDPTPAVTAT